MDNQELKKAGLKATTPRLRILKLLETATLHHMTAEEIYRAVLAAGEDIGLATVYRVLTQFEAAGLVKRHRFSDEQSVFELNQGIHHDHLVCVKCGSVAEFVDDIIEARQREIARKAGYEMTDHSLNIYGICRNCKKTRGKGL